MLKTLLTLIMLTTSVNLFADDMLVEKKLFETQNFKTFNGNIISEVKVGWESYGTLNANKDNVILITHYLTGNSHAAGKYANSDEKPGYWDSIIGPGKTIDTDKYFVISSDTLVNASVFDKNVITTGPATINPKTNEAYGLTFPVVTIRDFVNVQKALLDSLGIKKLHAVIGASMGSMQAIDWATAYPNMVDRVISIIGMVETDAWTTTVLEQWSRPIKLDKNWNKGNYYKGDLPLDGLTSTLMALTQQSMHPNFINAVNAKHSQLEVAPLNDINAPFKVIDWLENFARNRAKLIDANHILYLIRANQLFIAGYDIDLKSGLEKIQAKTLFIPATNDLLLMPYMARKGKDGLKALGKNVQYDELKGNMGHLDGVFSVLQKSKLISDFLNN